MKLRFLGSGAASLAVGVVVAACGSSSSTSTNGQTSDGGLLEDGGSTGANDGGGGTSGGDASLGGGAGGGGGGNDGSAGGGTTDGGTGGDDDSGGGGTTTVALRGTHTTGVNLTVNGVVRTYDITIPTTCDASTKVPIIFLFHGDGGRGNDMYTGFSLEASAAAAGKDAIYVYPNGLDDNENGSSWNIYDDPGPYPYTAAQTKNEDVAFFDAMVTNFGAGSTACADASHVFITGFSNGGYLSEQLARWRSSVVKASAPQSGGSPSGTDPSDYPSTACPGLTGPVPTMVIHGQSDGVVDPCLANQDVSYWSIANSCANSAQDCASSTAECEGNLANPPATPTTAVSPSPCVSSNGCKTGEPVIFCFIPGLGHDFWSGAPDAVWNFFSSIEGS